MPDSNNNNNDNTPNIPRSFRLADFPLLQSIANFSIGDDINAAMNRPQQLQTATTNPTREQTPSAASSSTNTVNAQGKGNGNNSLEKEKRKPVVTLVSALAPTTYRDRSDENGAPKSLAYITAQRKVLQFLDKAATDQLNAAAALAITQSIDPIYKSPSATEAVRLCYYMREQGFDTYALIDPAKTPEQEPLMKLFVVNQKSNDRNDDYLYWKQNLKTGAIHDIHIRPSTRVTTRSQTIDEPNAMLQPLRDLVARAPVDLGPGNFGSIPVASTVPGPTSGTSSQASRLLQLLQMSQPVGMMGGANLSDFVTALEREARARLDEQVGPATRLEGMQERLNVLLNTYGDARSHEIQGLIDEISLLQASQAGANSNQNLS